MGSKNKKVTVGYHYYMNVHLALGAQGIQEIQEIRVGDRQAWVGSLNGASSALVSQTGLFGGERREGGVCGIVDFMPGGRTQPQNPSIREALNEATGSPESPNYRGISSVFMKGFDGVNMSGTPWEDLDPGDLPADKNDYESVTNMDTIMSELLYKVRHNFSFCWSAMNPYFKVPWFKVRRNFDEWYPEKASINGNSNPAHVYYEILTNTEWGMGTSGANIDDADFRVAADRFYDEGLGLSFTWDAQQSYNEIIEFVNDHCNANLLEDRITGLWRLKLIRDDFDFETIPELNESNCRVVNISGKTLSDTINEVVVSYTNMDDGTEETVSAQDLANFVSQGRVNSQKRDYPGITDPELAQKMAFRDLATLSKPLKKVTVEADRSFFLTYPGDPVKLVWPREGMNGLVFRVGSMNLGRYDEGKIVMDLVEDVFGLPTTVYTSVSPAGWVNTDRYPEPVNVFKLFEMSYYEVYTSTTEADRTEWAEDTAFGAVAAKAPNSDSVVFGLYDDVTGEIVDEGSFAAVVELGEDVTPSETQITLSTNAFIDVYKIVQGGLAWLNDELIEITNYDLNNKVITVNRGCIDTIPVSHSTGDLVFLYQDSEAAFDDTLRVENEQVDYRLLTETSKGALRVGAANVESFNLTGRMNRPYPPGNVRVNGVVSPSTLDGEFNIQWAHRDRTQQLAGIPKFTDSDIGPEEGVEYTLKVFDEDDQEVVSEVLTNNSYLYDNLSEMGDLGKTVPGYSGIFSNTVNTFDPLSDVWVSEDFKPIVFDGTYVYFNGTARNIVTNQIYTVHFYMLPGGTALEFDDNSRKPSEGKSHKYANGIIAYNINQHFNSVSAANARSAGQGQWNTSEISGSGSDNKTDLNHDGTQFFAVRYDFPFTVYTSTTGHNYSQQDPDMGGVKFRARQTAYIGGKYYLGGKGEFTGLYDSFGEPIYTVPLMVSDDLLTFTQLNFPEVFDAHNTFLQGSTSVRNTAGYVWDIFEFDGKMLVNFSKVVPNSDDLVKLYSTDDGGVTWVDVTPTGNHLWKDPQVLNGKLYMFKEDEVIETTDLVNWVTSDLSSLVTAGTVSASFTNFVVADTYLFMTLVETYWDTFNGNQVIRYRYKHFKTQDMEFFAALTDINANVLVGDAQIEHRLNSRLRFELWSTNSNGDSIQKHNHTVERVGYGYNYGNYYGGN